MTALAREPRAGDAGALETAVEFVIPVYNEERVLAEWVHRLDDYLREGLPDADSVVDWEADRRGEPSQARERLATGDSRPEQSSATVVDEPDRTRSPDEDVPEEKRGGNR